MEPEGSLPYSQVPVTCPYPEPNPSSAHNPLQILKSVYTGKLVRQSLVFFFFGANMFPDRRLSPVDDEANDDGVIREQSVGAVCSKMSSRPSIKIIASAGRTRM
jgi:hypothetical protein